MNCEIDKAKINETLQEQQARIAELQENLTIKEIMLEELSKRRKADIKAIDEKYEKQAHENEILKRELEKYRNKAKNVSNARGELRHYLRGLSDLKSKSETKVKTKEMLYQKALDDLKNYY